MPSTSAGYSAPVTLPTSGISGGAIGSRSSTWRSGSLAGATISVWKAWLTGMRTALIPRAANAPMARRTASDSPPTTHWRSELMLAATT